MVQLIYIYVTILFFLLGLIIGMILGMYLNHEIRNEVKIGFKALCNSISDLRKIILEWYDMEANK